MNIEEAIQKLKRLELKDFGKKRKFDLQESEVAYITVLNELDKKDKVINYMGDWLDNELGKGAKEDFIKRAGVN